MERSVTTLPLYGWRPSLLGCICLVLVASTYAQLSYNFAPPFTQDPKAWHDTSLGEANATSSANKGSGEVAAFAQAWTGAAVGEAKQYVTFTAPYDGIAEVEATITYLGGNTLNYGPAAFAGICAVWEIDGYQSTDIFGGYRKWIDHPFGYDDIAGLVFEFAGLVGGVPVPEEMMDAIDLLDTLTDAVQFMNTLASMVNVSTCNVRFCFPASAGSHEVGIGVRCEASGFVIGTGNAIIAGAVSDIRITVHPRLVITNNTTWDEDKVLRGGVLVDSGAILTITPGHTIAFGSNTPCNVKGILNANNVVFTSYESSPASGDCDGIILDGSVSSQSVLDGCTIRYGGRVEANIKCLGSSPTLRGCRIERSGHYGIWAEGGLPTITGNQIVYNTSHGLHILVGGLSEKVAGNSYANNGADSIEIIGESVTTVTDFAVRRWKNDGVPYVVRSDIKILFRNSYDASTLFIDPGVTVRFDPATGLTIWSEGPMGVLDARGVIFTSNAQTPIPGDWDGIYIYNAYAARTSHIENSLIEYGTGISCENSSLDIKNCTLRYSSGSGLFGRWATVTVSGCTITENQEYGVCFYHPYSPTLKLQSNTLSNNGSYPLFITSGALSENVAGNTYSGNHPDAIGIVAGDVGWKDLTPRRWRNEGIPYHICHTYGGGPVPDDYLQQLAVACSLTIDPETVLKFDSHTGMVVACPNQHAFMADHVIFTSDAQTPSPGDWYGISFGGGSASRTPRDQLSNCVIEYGGKYGANIYCQDASPILTDCTIRFSSGSGIQSSEYGHSGKTVPAITGCIIRDNAKYGISYTGLGKPTIQNNRIFDNGACPLHISAAGLNENTVHNTCSGNTPDVIEVEGGLVGSLYSPTHEFHWLNGDLEYHVLSDIHVSTEWSQSYIPMLTIDPGTIVKFNPGAGLQVGGPQDFERGILVAKKVTFSSKNQTPAPGDWKGISIQDHLPNPGTLQSILEDCIIEYGGGDDNTANIYCRDSSPSIRNSILRYSKGSGFYGPGSSPQMIGCQLHDNTAYGIYCDGGTISNNHIFRNGSYPLHISAQGLSGNVGGNRYDGNDPNAIEVTGTAISRADGFWANDAVPYHVRSYIYIRSGTESRPARVTIDPGAVLKFDKSAGIVVGGYGAAERAILTAHCATFTSNALIPARGDWSGINFIRCWGDSSSSLLEDCLVEYGGGLLWNIGSSFCSPVIRRCTVRFSATHGIYTSGPFNPTIQQCDVYGNTGYGVFSPDQTINAANFWWGDASGPYHPIFNPAGLGDSVDDKVVFRPWRTQAAPLFYDVDADGHGYSCDNCPETYNPSQRDSDGDGRGDVCDTDCPDLDGTTAVGLEDFQMLASQWQQEGPDLTADFNKDGTVGLDDLLILSRYWVNRSIGLFGNWRKLMILIMVSSSDSMIWHSNCTQKCGTSLSHPEIRSRLRFVWLSQAIL